ncbi:SCO family protein [Oceanospirillum sp.]|uniref:SCO family protein n=1 Tax=Oceanospirillum sp. TaxID=2021254 RepID=UPI003A9205C6
MWTLITLAYSTKQKLGGLLLSLSMAALLFALPFLPGLLNSSDYYGLKRNLDIKDLQLPYNEKKSLNVLFFGYLQCGTVCPQQLLNLKTLHDRLAGQPVRFTFITIDPNRDTPEKLQRAMSALGQSFQSIRPASQEKAQDLARIMADTVSVRPDQQGYEIDHSGFIYVVSQDQRLELVYTSSALDLNRVEQDLKRLITVFEDRA